MSAEASNKSLRTSATTMGEDLPINGDVPANTSPGEQSIRRVDRRITLGQVASVSVLLFFVALLAIGLRREWVSDQRAIGVAPDFEFTTFSGETIRLADLKGQGVVLNFWASWCLPCRTEAPLLEAAWRRERDKGIVFIGLAYLDQEPAAKAFLDEFDITYPTGPDLQSAAARRYRITGVPETFFIGADGKIVSTVIGPITSADYLTQQLDAIRPLDSELSTGRQTSLSRLQSERSTSTSTASTMGKEGSLMIDLGLVFLTGLTTGGLSCLAVQGGLLASSVAQQAEQTFRQQSAIKPTKRRVAQKRQQGDPPRDSKGVAITLPPRSLLQPITLFLVAKLVAYAILGFLLGWLGSILQLTPLMQAVMQMAIGIFMVGMALRMFNVHPFFRYFVIEPPAFITRYIRRRAKSNTDSMVTPLFLGALTVLIPCGITQVMMAAAVGSGDPVQGAAILFAFTLGTSPLFFALAYLATQMGKKLEARFMHVVAAVVLVLGVVSVNSSLTLMGTPIFSPRVATTQAAPSTIQPAPPQGRLPSSWKVLSAAELGTSADAGQIAPAGVQGNVITIHVTNSSYEPQTVQAPAGQPLQLKLVTNNTWGCTRAFVLSSLGIQKILPDTGETVIELPAQAAGSSLVYTCSMGMYFGVIEF
jgi:uncharacterized protein